MHAMAAALGGSPSLLCAQRGAAVDCFPDSVSVCSSSVLRRNSGQQWRRGTQDRAHFRLRSRGRRNSVLVPVATAAEQTTTSQVVTTPRGLQIWQTQTTGSPRVALEVRVPAELCKKFYDDTLERLNKSVKGKGFRPKLPEWMILRQLGQKRVAFEALKLILEKTLPEAMGSVAGRAVKDSEQIVTKFESLLESFTPTSPLSYNVTVDVLPEIKWKSEEAYKHISIEVKARDASALQSEAEAELLARHKDLGSLRVVVGRGLEMKDVAIINVTADCINEDGTLGDSIESCSQKGFSLDTDEAALYVPGLIENMMNQKSGETRTFDLTFPPTWNQEDLRNVKARFTVECKELFRRVLPELNDELASKLHEGCEALDQVRKELFKKHQLIEDNYRKSAAREAIIKQLPEVIDVEVPRTLLEEQGRELYASRLMEMHVKQQLSKEAMDSMTSEEVVNNFIHSRQDEIAAIVKQSIAIGEIFKQENLEYSKEEQEREYNSAIEEFKRYNQEYDKDRVLQHVQELLEAGKVLDWLVEHADIRYVTET